MAAWGPWFHDGPSRWHCVGQFACGPELFGAALLGPAMTGRAASFQRTFGPFLRPRDLQIRDRYWRWLGAMADYPPRNAIMFPWD